MRFLENKLSPAVHTISAGMKVKFRLLLVSEKARPAQQTACVAVAFVASVKGSMCEVIRRCSCDSSAMTV